MRIENSTIKLSSAYQSSYIQKQTKITTIRPFFGEDRVDIVPSRVLNRSIEGKPQGFECENSKKLSEKLRVARFLLEILFGFKIPELYLKEKAHSNESQNIEMPEQFEVTHIEISEKFEKEEVSLSLEGSIKTEDGRIFNFNLTMNMKRSLYEVGVSVTREVQGKDPIVLNLSGMFYGLADNTFDFDIDADGVVDNIHFVKHGSGVLVMDKNGDGIINNGTEVLGAKSGNAISELSTYDEDKNGWIDEGDTVFLRLSVWEKDPSGKDIITPLKDKGIGAISLRSVHTPIQIKNPRALYGEIIDSGVFVFENWRASTFHRINLFV